MRKLQKMTAMSILMAILMSYFTVLFTMYEVFAEDLIEKVGFEVYFENAETKQKEYSKTLSMDDEGGLNKFVIDLSVLADGYLRDSKVVFENPNFVIGAIDEKNSSVESVEDNTININQIKTGKSAKIEIPVSFVKKEIAKESDFNNLNKVHFTGTFLDKEGNDILISKDAEIEIKWQKDAFATISSSITKYVPYDVNGEKGLLVEESITTGIENNVLPYVIENISVNAPNVNGYLPFEVKAIGADEFAYENKKINMVKANKIDSEGNVEWQTKYDDFKIIYKYPAEAITDEPQVIKLSGEVVVDAFEDEVRKLQATYSEEPVVEGQISSIVDYSTYSTSSISKGLMYSNYDKVEGKVETVFTSAVSASIGDTTLTDSLEIDVINDQFENGVIVPEYIKTVYVDPENLVSILGYNADINFYVGDQRVAGINEKEGDLINNLFTIDLSQYATSNLRITCSKPINVGDLYFRIDKAIYADLDMVIEKELLEKEKAISTTVNGIARHGDFVFVDQTREGTIELLEPVMKSELVFNKETLSTIGTNENVQIKAILHTDTADCKLYKNPRITIDMPTYIRNMNIKNIEVLYDNELQISSFRVEGYQVIIDMVGTQTNYNIDALAGGTNIIITADLEIDDLTPTQSTDILMTVINEEDILETTTPISAVASQGILMANTAVIDGANYTSTVDNNEVKIATESDAKVITIAGSVVNNYDNLISGVQVLGKIATDNLQIVLDSNVRVTTNANVYYSENSNATRDLNDPTNGWTTSYNNNTTRYLIDIPEVVMGHGDRFDFSYDAIIPANLDYEMETNENYKVYFNNYIEDGFMFADEVESKIVTVGTGTNVVLEVRLTSDVEEGSTVREGQLVGYYAEITNTGRTTAKNVKLGIDCPVREIFTKQVRNDAGELVNQYVDRYDVESVKVGSTNVEYMYYDYEDMTRDWMSGGNSVILSSNDNSLLESIQPGQTIKIPFNIYYGQFKITKQGSLPKVTYVKERGSNGEEIKEEYLVYPTLKDYSINVSVRADDQQLAANANPYNLNFAQGDMKVQMEDSVAKDVLLTKGTKVTYYTAISEMHQSDGTKDVYFEMDLPQGIKAIGIKYDVDNLAEHVQETINGSKVQIRISEFGKYVAKWTDANGTAKQEDSSYKTLVIEVETEVEDDTERNINVYSTVQAVRNYGVTKIQGETIRSNVMEHSIRKVNVTAIHDELANKYVKEGTNAELVFHIINKNKVRIGESKFIFNLPDEYNYDHSYVELKDSVEPNGVEIMGKAAGNYGNRQYTLDLTPLNEEDEYDIKLYVKANKLPDGIKEKQVETYATVTLNAGTSTDTNKVESIVEYDNEKHDSLIYEKDARDVERTIDRQNDYGRGTSSETPGTTTPVTSNSSNIISGLVWNDTNKNGQVDSNERKLSNVPVYLVNKLTNTVIDRGITTQDGTYQFNNIVNGSYIVVFEYNTSKFEITAYKATGVNEGINNDAISGTFELNGTSTKVAYTDTIAITNNNARNVNLGLISKIVSDLKISKEVDSITASNDTGTVKYNYDGANRKLAKREITPSYVDSTTLSIRYVITVTNEGQTTEYVRKIADYLPEGLNFSSELNPSWSSSESGMIINSNMSDTPINPGESKSVELILTMTTSNEKLGVVSNSAEIYESYNEEGAIDRDSNPGNRSNKEDDYSTADIILGIKTGADPIVYILVPFAIIIPLSVGVVFLRRLAIESADNA